MKLLSLFSQWTSTCYGYGKPVLLSETKRFWSRWFWSHPGMRGVNTHQRDLDLSIDEDLS